jgi:hypothetical protein
MTRPRPTKIIKKLKKYGEKSLSLQECCRLVTWHMEKMYEWQQTVYDKIWGSGGGGTPPPPPQWPPA